MGLGMDFNLPALLNLGFEILVVSVTAGVAVYRSVKAGLDHKINGMEGRLGGKIDGVNGDLRKLEGKIDGLTSEVKQNSQRIAVLRDRWDRQSGRKGGGR